MSSKESKEEKEKESKPTQEQLMKKIDEDYEKALQEKRKWNAIRMQKLAEQDEVNKKKIQEVLAIRAKREEAEREKEKEESERGKEN